MAGFVGIVKTSEGVGIYEKYNQKTYWVAYGCFGPGQSKTQGGFRASRAFP